ncbi:BamA/TamA family outer membrane protein [Chitinophaga sp. Mgbs1]|uniref:BamA/TamA family outer membrane protein n=1 Tax=Chitinophaga solisilvae TaxID=1233460 RepID=A0A9Q5D818_9BACT|nr:BamA/TamA family outer membrane protein [Chitinophaga solisilvae]
MVKKSLVLILVCAGQVAYARQAAPADTMAPAAPKGVYNRILHYLQHTNEVKKKKKFDISFIGGPVYTPETSAGIAVMVAAQYRTDHKDSLLPVSNVAVYGSVALTGFYGLGLNSTTIFPKDRFRLSLKASFSSRPDKYWGIGFEDGSNKDDYTKYVQLTEKLQADFSVRVSRALFAGASLQVQHTSAADIDSIAGHPVMQPGTVLGIGIGPYVVYDTRDFIPNPYKGIYVRFGFRSFPSFLGNNDVFSKFDLQFDWYRRLWKGAILATDLYVEERSGTVPWSMLAEAGGSNRLRGYYEGRYRDKNLLAGQVELRQHIYRRSGMVAWIGAGNVYSEFKHLTFSKTLVSYGIGYRWEFKNRVNIRLDYGRGQDQQGFYFGINEVF